jgi:hypothetical protein
VDEVLRRDHGDGLRRPVELIIGHNAGLGRIRRIMVVQYDRTDSDQTPDDLTAKVQLIRNERNPGMPSNLKKTTDIFLQLLTDLLLFLLLEPLSGA